MIKHIIVLSCDGCGDAVEEDKHMTTQKDVIWWAERKGWWSDPDSVRHYCPACKVAAKLALARKPMGAKP